MNITGRLIVVVAVWLLSSMVKDYDHIKNCEKYGYSDTFIHHTKLVCTVEVSNGNN